jgi:hypothetical protein
MTTQTTHRAAPIVRPNLLRYALRADALFSAATGIISLAAAQPLATLIGIEPPLVFYGLGIVLLLYAAFLFLKTRHEQIDRRFAIVIIALNAIWVLDSVVVLVTGWLPLTSAGMWIIAILALVVATLAELQFFGLRRTR